MSVYQSKPRFSSEITSLVIAWVHGADIQFRMKPEYLNNHELKESICDDKWVSVIGNSVPEWDNQTLEFRIKKQIKIGWINIYNDGGKSFHDTKEEADISYTKMNLHKKLYRIACVQFKWEE